MTEVDGAVLYVVATPIGNLEDLTLRARRILGEVDVIFAEDTRVSRKLLAHYDIHIPLESLNARTEEQKIEDVLVALQDGNSIAYVTDAGTPTISDPGARLVRAVRAKGFNVFAVPGPSALTAALSVAGVPASRFLFLGFLPHKKGRETLFEEIAVSKYTTVFFESPHRILKTLTSLAAHLAEGRRVVLAKELTKIHEEVLSGAPSELLQRLTEEPDLQKGEFVVIVEAS